MSDNEKDSKSTLLDLIRGEKSWLALEILGQASLADRVEISIRAFKEACAHHDDESSLQWFTWLMQAIKEHDEANYELAKSASYDEKEVAKKEAEIRIACRQASLALELYSAIHKFKLEPSRYHDVEPSKHPTLQKTQAAIFETILGGWKYAETNELADEFFMALYRIDENIMFYGQERDSINNAIRKITDYRFPITRLVYTLRKHPGLYTDILGHAWVNHCSSNRFMASGSELKQILEAVSFLYEATPAATKFVGETGNRILAVDRQLRGLMKTYSLEPVYTSPDAVTLVFNVRGRQETDLHRHFEKARAGILNVRKNWPIPVRITLQGELVDPFDKSVLQKRTEDI